MILLDVQVPSLNKIYDFELEEEIPVGELIVKIMEIIAQKEGLECCMEDKMYLYAMGSETLLNDACSLKQQGIRGGERLYLI